MSNGGFWDEFDKMSQQAESGGGGAICHVTIMAGFKVFGHGLSPKKAFFPVPDGKDIKAVKAKATKVCKEVGADFPKWGIGIIADKDRYYVRGKQRVYDNDRYFFRSRWNEKQDKGKYAVLLPALEQLDIKVVPPWEGWIRLGWASDPYAVEQGESAMEEGTDGVMRYPTIEVPVEVFENEAAAMAAVKEMPTGDDDGGLPAVPDGYSEQDWADTVDQHIAKAIKSDLGSKGTRETITASLSADFGVHPSYIEAIVERELRGLVTAAAKEKMDSGLPEAAVTASLTKSFGVDAGYIKAVVDDIVPV
jgi:hypothetical protein